MSTRVRGPFLAAAVLTAAATTLPLWGFRMSARQYPGESLHLRVTTSAITGDVQEITTLQKYIGVRFPTDLPELRWLRPALVSLALLFAVAAALGSGRPGRAAAVLAVLASLALVVGSAATLQTRLYAVGHERDPGAPMRGVKDFTPPLIGPMKVGNFTMWSFPHLGGCLLGAAAVLSLLGARAALRRGHAPKAPGRGLVARGAAVALIAVSFPAGASARGWTVGGAGADFPLITPALAAAGDGDVIRVRRGVYREDLVIRKRVALRGEGWPTLMGTGQGSVVEVRGNGTEVSGLVIEESGTGLTQRMDAAVTVLGDGNRILGNRMRRVFYGVVLAGGSRNEVRGNDITGFLDLPFSRRGDGIYAYRSPDNVVADNHVVGQRDGIYFQYAPGSHAARNTVEACRYGLHDMFSDGALIEGNVFRSSSAGANVMNSRKVRLLANRFERNRGVSAVGLSLKDCDESLVEGNTFSANATGIKVEGSTRNRFRSNRLVDNDTGVSLFASAEANVFTRNAFARNGSDVVLRGRGSRTRWSEDGAGNRWDGYRGLDFDGDGRGNSVHPILGAFERVEGNNPAARLFLRSPSAAALELAARFAPDLREEASDAAPLVGAREGAADPARGLRSGGAALALAVLLGLGLAVERRACSR
jgi:nitrous oxidase accessory protein